MCAQDTSAEVQQRHSSNYRPDIDGLRALAVLAVVTYHLDADWLPGGFTGVDIFFVISGYVVCDSLTNRLSPSPFDYFVDFYLRRIKRLVPSLLMAIVLGSLCTAALVPPWYIQSGYHLWAAQLALVGASNLFFGLATTDSNRGYFEADAGGPTENPFTHTW